MNNEPIIAAAHADPISAYDVALDAYNSGVTSEDLYLDALHHMDGYEPRTGRDFIRKFAAMWREDGNPNKERTKGMLASAARLLGDAPQSAWTALMRRYVTVKASDDAFMADHYMAHFRKHQADKSYPIPEAVDGLADVLGDHKGDLQDALMAMPAPDGAALLWKLDTLMASYADGIILSDWYVSQTIADYHRLLGDA